MTTIITITLADVADAVADVVGESLDPSTLPVESLPIVERLSRRIDIVDGYHRLAGMVAWANERGLDLADVTVRCLTSDDSDLLADAANAERPSRQSAAIAAIVAAL